jgi:putative tryptophan/tyrosine transport system substrate-binding protein
MRRREFIAGLGSAAAWPVAARAQQQQAVPVIGYLGSRSADDSAGNVAAFRKGLGETGYVEGRNVAIEYRWADGQNDRLPVLAAELVRRSVVVLAVLGNSTAAFAAKAATRAIPIVFLMGANPIGIGLVTSLARPGANITGVTIISGDLLAKRLEFLHVLVPAASSIALLVNPANQAVVEAEIRQAQAAARVLGVRVLVLNATNSYEIDTAFAAIAEQRIGALLTSADPLWIVQRVQLAALTARHAVPAIYGVREIVDVGGLMSYGASTSDANRLVGTYVGRILKGEKPADLPIVQPTKFDLVINLKTAKALGLTIPERLLATADQVIE